MNAGAVARARPRAASVSGEMGRRFSRTVLHAVVLLICALWMVPTVGLLVSSFRPKRLIASTGWWTAFSPPLQFTLDLYGEALTASGMAQSFANSLVITIPATLLPIMLAAFVAYVFAWMRFPGRDLLFVGVVALLIVPLQMTFVPVLRLFNALGLSGTFFGIWLIHTAYGLPFCIYLLRNFFGSLPKELFESAYLDGASPLTAFFRLVLPLSVPALASLAIFQFLWVWNDLLVALIYLGGTPRVAPLPLAITNQVSSLGANWQVMIAGAFISMVLPLIVFFGLQRYFVRGILAGSVKA